MFEPRSWTARAPTFAMCNMMCTPSTFQCSSVVSELMWCALHHALVFNDCPCIHLDTHWSLLWNSDPNELTVPLSHASFYVSDETDCEPLAQAPYSFMLLSRDCLKEGFSSACTKAVLWKVGKSIPALGFHKWHLQFQLAWLGAISQNVTREWDTKLFPKVPWGRILS